MSRFGFRRSQGLALQGLEASGTALDRKTGRDDAPKPCHRRHPREEQRDTQVLLQDRKKDGRENRTQARNGSGEAGHARPPLRGKNLYGKGKDGHRRPQPKAKGIKCTPKEKDCHRRQGNTEGEDDKTRGHQRKTFFLQGDTTDPIDARQDVDDGGSSHQFEEEIDPCGRRIAAGHLGTAQRS